MQRFTSTLRLRALRPSALPRTTATPSLVSIRHTSTSSPKSAEGASAESGGSRSKSAAESSSQTSSDSNNPGAMPDSLSDHDMRGSTGGGKPLESSQSAPKQPKVWNHSVSGSEPGKGLTEEQQREVDEHNADFEKKHDRASPAEDDRVDKSFWDRDAGSKD
jgi:hypothetical protein